MLAVKSRNRRLACRRRRRISFGTSIADATVGGTIAVGTMIANACPTQPVCHCPTPIASASPYSSNSMLMRTG
jgi:hypothetical protein